MRIHDLIGVGFGPSNIALAIALEERREAGRPIDALFLEKQPAFAWHPHMLLSHAHIGSEFGVGLEQCRNINQIRFQGDRASALMHPLSLALSLGWAHAKA